MSFKRFRPRRTRLILLPVVAATLLAGAARADEAAEVAKLMRAGQQAEAMKRADAYLARVPRDAQVRFMKGVLLSETKPAEAIAIFAALTEDYPRLPEPYNNLAVLYAASGQYEKARAALDKAIRTNPAYATAYQNLGDVHARLASLEYEKALQVDPGAGAKMKLALMPSLGSAAAPAITAAPAQSTAAGARASPPARAAQAALPKADSMPAPSRPVETQVAQAPKPEARPAAKPAAPMPPLAKADPAPAPPQAPRAAARPEPSKPEAAPVRVAKAEKMEKPERADPKARAAQEAAAERGAVLGAVTSWAHAWSERDVPAYLAHYAPDFEPPKGLSRKAWSEERHARIAGKGRIEVRVEKPQIEINGNKASVRFHQVYMSDRLSATGRKTLQLERQRNGKWQIIRESTA
jgi:tetratricopeptide (TPR) repeat protein